MNRTKITLIVGLIILVALSFYFFSPTCLPPEMIGYKDICVKSNKIQILSQQLLQNFTSTTSVIPTGTIEENLTPGPLMEKLPWENSTCGNSVCEMCESSDSCCNYPPVKDKNGTMIYPPPTCMGKCEQDCTIPTKTVDCGEPDSEGRCANGCVNYGVPLGCITKEENERCEKSKYGCPICLSSSTMIAGKKGAINVKNLTIGMLVWTLNKEGQRELQPIIKLSNSFVGKTHNVSRLTLIDGRILDVSPSHPTTNGKPAGDLRIGELYDGTVVQSNQLVPYQDTKTYDLLPAGYTGYYFANGILMGSTLKR